MKHYPQMSMRCSVETAEAVERFAAARGVGRSDVMRDGVALLLALDRLAAEGGFEALAAVGDVMRRVLPDAAREHVADFPDYLWRRS